jgi:hypothetical protein
MQLQSCDVGKVNMNSGAATLYPYFIKSPSRAQGVVAGFIDRNGTPLIAAQYADAGPFKEGLAPVQSKGRWGLISSDGQLVFPYAWPFPAQFVNGFAVVRILRGGRERRGFLKRDGAWIVEPQYKLATPFSCRRAQVFDGLHYGFIDEDGVEVIPLRFEDSRPFGENLAPVKLANAWGYIDTNGEFAITPRFDLAMPFHEGVARVQAAGKWGFINRMSEWVIPPNFALLLDMRCGRAVARVQTNSGMGYLDNKGGFAIPPVYDHVTSFQEDRGWVKAAGQRFRQCIDLSGELVYSNGVLASEPFQSGLSFIETESMIGYVDMVGSLVWHGEYVERPSRF